MNCPSSDAYSYALRMYLWRRSNIMTQLKTELGRGIGVLVDRKLALYDIQAFHFGIAMAEAFDYFLHSFRTPIDF